MKTYPVPHGWNCPKFCSNQMTVTTANGTHHRGWCSICQSPLNGPGYWVPKPENFDEPITPEPVEETPSLFENDPHADLKQKVRDYREFTR